MQKTKIPKEIVIEGQLVIQKEHNGKDFAVSFVNKETKHWTSLGSFYHDFSTKFNPSTRLENVRKLLKVVTRPQEYDFIPDLSPLFS